MTLLIERCLPTRALSGLVHRAARSPVLRPLLVRGFLQRYPDAMDQAAEEDPASYPDFNALFTRALKPGSRVVDSQAMLVSPVDGVISQIGRVRNGRIIQAKGHDFTATELLGDNANRMNDFENGSFATIYLAPRDYHRIHMPQSGDLTEVVHLPGRLLSVREKSVNSIANLYARNERVACLFDKNRGRLAVVMVGAFGVGSISVGAVPGLKRDRRARRYLFRGQTRKHYETGDELGRFNLGSTVIVLMNGDVAWDPAAKPGTRVLMGQRLA